MPWVEKMKTTITEMKSSNWIAQETRSQAANGNKLEICNLQDQTTCLLHFRNLMISVEHSAATTNSPKTIGPTKKHFDFLFFLIILCTNKNKWIMISTWWPNKNCFEKWLKNVKLRRFWLNNETKPILQQIIFWEFDDFTHYEIY